MWRLIEDVESGIIDQVLTVSPNRLSPNYAELLLIWQITDAAGVSIRSISEGAFPHAALEHQPLLNSRFTDKDLGF